MKFDRPLDRILGQRSKVALLRHLVRTRAEQSGRELGRFLGLDQKTCHAALRDLAEQGLVECRAAGTARLYKLNDRHALVTGILEPAFEKETSLLADYAKELRELVKLPLVSIILFGSVARGEERAQSDVDLVLVTRTAKSIDAAEDALDRATVSLATRYGNPPQILTFAREDFRKRARAGDGLVSEILRTGRVLYGKPFSEILKNGS